MFCSYLRLENFTTLGASTPGKIGTGAPMLSKYLLHANVIYPTSEQQNQSFRSTTRRKSKLLFHGDLCVADLRSQLYSKSSLKLKARDRRRLVKKSDVRPSRTRYSFQCIFRLRKFWVLISMISSHRVFYKWKTVTIHYNPKRILRYIYTWLHQ